MREVALTGNAAAGKSSVAELFRRWGTTVIDADQLVREAQAPGTPTLAAIVGRFGTGVLAEGGTLDRPKLRAVVLADPAARHDLEAIVHPEVERRRARLVADARNRGEALVVSDIPLLFEAGDPAAFDGVILVEASPAVRRARLVARGLPPVEADRLIAAQTPSELKRCRSTFVIENDGVMSALERRSREVWQALQDA